MLFKFLLAYFIRIENFYFIYHCRPTDLMEDQSSSNGILSTHSSLTTDFQEANDWTYSMRREMQEIVKGLFLGPYSVAVRSKV